MSFVHNIKLSHKKDKDIEPKKKKNNLIFNTMADLDKFNYYKSKKMSKSKSSSIIIQKRKNSEKKRHIFIPINLKGPSIKTNNDKKKISYNKSTSDLINDRYYNFNNKINNNEFINKTKKNSQHNTINYIINNLSSNKKESTHHKKFNEFKGISKSIVSPNNNKKLISNNNINNNNLMYEELKKENEKLVFLFNEKIKDNKKNKNKIDYLENKNEQILKKIHKIKKENDKYAKILEKVLKLLQILKSNGLDVEEILENLSYTEDEEIENNSDDISSINSNKSNRNYELNSENPHLKSDGESILSENKKIHKLYKESKVTLKENSIPKLDMKKIYNNNNTLNIKKFETNNTHKHKNYSHSVGK